MKTTLATILIALSLCLSAAAQNQPLTTKQCRTNFILWKAALADGGESSISVSELQQREVILVECGVVFYRQGNKAVAQTYGELADSYEYNMSDRYRKYIIRHGEWDKFLADDAAGKR